MICADPGRPPPSQDASARQDLVLSPACAGPLGLTAAVTTELTLAEAVLGQCTDPFLPDSS